MMEAIRSSKSRFLEEPHCVTSQETSFFVNYRLCDYLRKQLRERLGWIRSEFWVMVCCPLGCGVMYIDRELLMFRSDITGHQCRAIESWNSPKEKHRWRGSAEVGNTAVTMKNAVICNVTLCDSYKNRRFGRAYRSHYQLLVPSSLILVTLKMEAIRRHIPEECILHSHRLENLKSYIALTGWTL
jgi:hypothetical protein